MHTHNPRRQAWCRRYNIERWPFRKLVSIEKLIAAAREAEGDGAPDSGGGGGGGGGSAALITELGAIRERVLSDPSYAVPPGVGAGVGVGVGLRLCARRARECASA
eukprot:205918-Chlamydomonas_euryale.AAC.1